MNTFTRLGAATATAVLALGLAAPAQAARYTYTDKSGDVQVEVCDDETQECTPKTVTSVADGDVLRSSVQHRDRTVVLRTAYRALSKGRNSLMFGRIVTNEGLKRQVLVFIDADGSSDAVLLRPNGDKARCAMGKTVSWADDIIEVRIPRSCLSAPRWIQAGQSYWRLEQASATSTRWWGDDAQSQQPNDNPVLSPRVRRG